MSFSFRYLPWILIQESNSMQVKFIKFAPKGAFGESGHARKDFDYSCSPTLLDIYPTQVKSIQRLLYSSYLSQHQADFPGTNN